MVGGLIASTKTVVNRQDLLSGNFDHVRHSVNTGSVTVTVPTVGKANDVHYRVDIPQTKS